ncbi:MAG: 23S rRNA (guanosine(2251)-2'-O)-methyltransferase RlmB [Candidatus Margulisiibacteriota bacterium]
MQCIKGRRAIAEAIRTETPIDRILMSYNLRETPEIQDLLASARSARIKVQKVSPDVLAKEGEDSQGLIAYVRNHQINELKYLIDNKEDYPFVVALDHLEDPYNFGAILRSCEQFGVKAVIFPKDRSCQITPGVIKASAGALYHLTLIRVVNIGQALERLKQEHYWIYGTDVETGRPLESFQPNFPMVLVMGNEGRGMATRTTKICDESVHITTKGQLDSLNVSVAAGILIHSLSQHLEG